MSKKSDDQETTPAVTTELKWMNWPKGALNDIGKEDLCISLHRISQEYLVKNLRIVLYEYSEEVKQESFMLKQKKKKPMEGIKMLGVFPSSQHAAACQATMAVVYDIVKKAQLYSEENRKYIRTIMTLDKI